LLTNPTINSEVKKEVYIKSQEMLLKASQYYDIPIEQVEIPFKDEMEKAIRLLLI